MFNDYIKLSNLMKLALIALASIMKFVSLVINDNPVFKNRSDLNSIFVNLFVPFN